MNIGIAALSEVQRPDSGEIMAGGYTYNWSGRSDGDHAQGVAVAVSNKLTPMIIEVILVNKSVMRLKIGHSLGIVSLVSAYAPTKASDPTVKNAFDTVFKSVPPGEILFSSWGISMDRLSLIEMVMRRVLVQWVWNCEPESN